MTVFTCSKYRKNGATVKIWGSVADPEGVQWVPWNPSFEEFDAQMAYVRTYILLKARGNHRDNEQSERPN